MTFDSRKFAAAKWTPRTRVIKTPELAPWFKDGVPAEVTVRNLTGDEVARANEAAGQAQKKSAIIEGLLAGGHEELAESIRSLVGASGETPADHVRRLELLQLGAMTPTFDLPAALALGKHLPGTFLKLTNAILELTGLGDEPGKPKGSGATPGSGPQ